MELLLGWLIFSALAGWISSSKGRSGLGTLLLSLILSPLVGVIVALAQRSGDAIDQQRARAGTSEHYRPCPECAEIVRREAAKCRHCGTFLSPGEPPPTGAQRFGRTMGEIFRSDK